MKKSIWIVIILVLILTLTACGSDTSDSQTSETNATEVTTSETTSETTAAQTEAVSETSENGDILAADIFKTDTKADSYAYELIMSSGGQVIGGFNLWVDGDKVRFDLTDQGQSMYFDYEKQEAYIYSAADNTLLKTPIETLGNEWESPFLFAEELDADALSSMNYKGSEKLDGKACQIFEYDNMGNKVTYYVWEEKGLILKIIMEIDGQPEYEYYFKNLELDGNFEKELELPEGAKIVG